MTPHVDAGLHLDERNHRSLDLGARPAFLGALHGARVPRGCIVRRLPNGGWAMTLEIAAHPSGSPRRGPVLGTQVRADRSPRAAMCLGIDNLIQRCLWP